MKKLIILNLFGLIAVVGVTALLFSNARGSTATLHSVDSFATVEVEALEIRTQMIAMSDAMRGFLLNPSKRDEYDNKKAADAKLVKAVERLLAATTNQEYAQLARQIGDLDEEKLDPIEDRVLDLAATDVKAATTVYFEDYLPIRVQQMALVDQLRDKAAKGFQDEVLRAESSMSRTMAIVLWAGGIVLLLMIGAFAWSVVTTRTVQRQLAEETTTLAETAHAVLHASREVSRGAQSLSQGASEQAAALEETSATMEEVASMTRKNAEHSGQTSMLMREVDGHVRASNGVLSEMVTSMAAIRDSSRQVANIIKTIDEVAFQTNILALNAAVEAARAGAAGMGFAVVADEVRNLAQRSAQAAKDTASMIETSLRDIQAGHERVGLVGESIAAITGSVATVKSLVEEVSTSSRAQAEGIEQVAQALSQMERVTQTTAATAEESAASSEELNAQAETAMDVARRLEALVGSEARRSSGGTSVATPAMTSEAPASLRRAA